MNNLITLLVISAVGCCLCGYWDAGFMLCAALFCVFIPIGIWLDDTKTKNLPTEVERLYDDTRYFKPDGTFGSLRWDPSIQDYRWFTEEDLVRYVDPETKEAHLMWPDELEELDEALREKAAEAS